ncbi:hypothetical protein [Chitinolyticbacter albus]|uniref:hypothetical protein n=1 Tax=Chitinolyticbacter albus TaxID=2961951 RepID=UPI00210D9CC0|nr:hypothetical protein [Chitinolyticbacter albus]
MSDQPIVEIITTDQPVIEAAGDASTTPSVLQRFRLQLMIAGGVLGVILLLGIGLAVGYFVREFNEKQYVDQITLLRSALQRNADGWREARLATEAMQGKLTELNATHAATEASYAVLKGEFEALKAQVAAASAAAHAATQPPAAAAAPADKGYLRFGNTRCVVRPGQKLSEMAGCLKREPITSGTSNAIKPVPDAAATPAPTKPHAPAP